MPTSERPINLQAIARETLSRYGFLTDFPLDTLTQAQQMREPDFTSLDILDRSTWLWSSIDNDDSRDLDQIEYLTADANGYSLSVGIADVASFIPRDSPLDKAAQHNTTSLYTGVRTFPLLPEVLSTNLTSLLEGQKRLAVVIEIKFSQAAEVISSSVYRAIVQNKAQLTYHAVAAFLDHTPPDSSPVTQRMIQKIITNSDIREQLILQQVLAQKLRARRIEAGALTFDTRETQVIATGNDQWELHSVQPSAATRLIEDFMIAANQAMVIFLQSKKFPSLRRIVRTPKNWPRIVAIATQKGTSLPATPDAKALEDFLKDQQAKDPDHYPDLSLTIIKLLGRGEYVIASSDGGSEHFALAVEGYAHATAPNRRYPDIITQRLALAASAQKPSPYSMNELAALAQRCTQKEDDANKASRSVHKSVAATILHSRLGDIFEGYITGASEKGIWVRILHPAVEGRIEGKTPVLAIGDHVMVKLLSTDPWHGYIDFVMAS